ncbi:MAG: HAD-IIB family hydrolase [Pseudomonadota bacterium]
MPNTTLMNYRALAIDLDGTLLVGEDLPDANRDALRAASAAGLTVIIATARWKEMAFRVADAAGLTDPVIACSGAQVHDRSNSQDLFDERLPADFTAELFALCDEQRCIATVTVDEDVLLKLDGKPDPEALDAKMRWVPKLSPTFDPDNLPRIAAIQGSAINNLIRSELAPRFSATVNYFDSVGPSGKLISTITAKAADKGAALKATCEHLDIDPATILAIGDAENDLAMFALAGTAVAMGQAEDRIKAAAQFVTGRNDEAGVAQVINRLLDDGKLESSQ